MLDYQRSSGLEEGIIELTREENSPARAREVVGLCKGTDAVDAAKSGIQDADLDEARERCGDHLTHEHCPGRNLHVMAEFEI